jgi:hypothetical protein
LFDVLAVVVDDDDDDDDDDEDDDILVAVVVVAIADFVLSALVASVCAAFFCARAA